MHTRIQYLESFTIPKKLAHAPLDEDLSNEIFNDDVLINPDGTLLLSTSRGLTAIDDFVEEEDSFYIPAGATAEFSGAYNALNACWGITFPKFNHCGTITSNLGRFETVEGYELARLCSAIAKGAERSKEVTKVREEILAVFDEHGNLRR